MCLIAYLRALVTTLVLASYSPVGIAHGSPDLGHTGHLAISLFVARRTRVAASQQFDVASRPCLLTALATQRLTRAHSAS